LRRGNGLSRTSLIWTKTILATGLDVGLATTIFILLGRLDWPDSVELRAALAVIIFLLVAILVMAAWLIYGKMLGLLQELRRLKYEPLINETLALEVVDGGQVEQLKRLARHCPAAVSDCVCAELSCVTGSAHRHISEVSCELGLLERWRRELRSHGSLRRCRAVRLLGTLERSMARAMLVEALSDDSEPVRIEAGRALVRWGDGEAVEAVLRFAASQPLLLRALVAEDLRHVMTSCERYLPQLLRDHDLAVMTGALDIITAWQKALAIQGFEALLEHRAAAVRVRALRLAPYILGGPGSFGHLVIAALFEPDAGIRAAAAIAAGAMGLTNAIPHLHSLLQAADERVSVSAAWALSRLGDSGTAVLEAEVLAGGPCAGFALEALERAQLGLELYDAA
jgi:HEAT repeat protein